MLHSSSVFPASRHPNLICSPLYSPPVSRPACLSARFCCCKYSALRALHCFQSAAGSLDPVGDGVSTVSSTTVVLFFQPGVFFSVLYDTVVLLGPQHNATSKISLSEGNAPNRVLILNKNLVERTRQQECPHQENWFGSILRPKAQEGPATSSRVFTTGPTLAEVFGTRF